MHSEARVTILDDEDRAHIDALVGWLALRCFVVFGAIAMMLLFAVTAGYAVWLFRFASGY